MNHFERRPWASGPAELLQHGLDLLRQDSDSARRLAMISIDNAVELSIRTYLTLPSRITGLRMSRADQSALGESFPRLLEGLEHFAPTAIGGVSLGEIEWYHRLRNQLYHQGNGLTVEREKAETYGLIAQVLFRALFGVAHAAEEADAAIRDEKRKGRFLKLWADLEFLLARTGYPEHLPFESRERVRDVMAGLLTPEEADMLVALAQTKRALIERGDDTEPDEDALQHLRRLSRAITQPPHAGSSADLHAKFARAWGRLEQALESKRMTRYFLTIASPDDAARILSPQLGRHAVKRLIALETVRLNLKHGSRVANDALNQGDVDQLWSDIAALEQLDPLPGYPVLEQLRGEDDVRSRLLLSVGPDSEWKLLEAIAEQRALVAAYQYDLRRHGTNARSRSR